MGFGETQKCGCGRERTTSFGGVGCCEVCHTLAKHLWKKARERTDFVLKSYGNVLAIAISRGELRLNDHEEIMKKQLEDLVAAGL